MWRAEGGFLPEPPGSQARRFLSAKPSEKPFPSSLNEAPVHSLHPRSFDPAPCLQWLWSPRAPQPKLGSSTCSLARSSGQSRPGVWRGFPDPPGPPGGPRMDRPRQRILSQGPGGDFSSARLTRGTLSPLPGAGDRQPTGTQGAPTRLQEQVRGFSKSLFCFRPVFFSFRPQSLRAQGQGLKATTRNCPLSEAQRF